MDIAGLVADREWLSQVRADFEAEMMGDRDAPATKSLIHYMLRLLDITLDYYSDCMRSASAGKLMDDQDVTAYIVTARRLGRQWSGSMDNALAGKLFFSWTIFRLYADGLAYVAREAPDDPRLPDFLHLALSLWGAFYARAEVHD